MDNYLESLHKAIEIKLRDHASTLPKIDNREVRSIEWIKVESIKGLPETTTKLFSGKELTITPIGSIRFMERKHDGARSVTMDFMASNTIVSFNSEEEGFVVKEIGELIFIDYN